MTSFFHRLLSKFRERKNSGTPKAHGGSGKPRVLLLVDCPNWAFDKAAKAVARYLSDEFEFHIAYVAENPDLSLWPFDLIYVFFWGETYHQKFVSDPRRVIKEISSHRWALEEQYGRLSAKQAAERYLADAATLTATSRRLQAAFAADRVVFHTPNGFEPAHFFFKRRRRGPLRIGWAGNERDPCKGLGDILRPAAGKDFDFVVAGGKLTRQEMLKFYNSIDVLCVASTAEGEPLTLIEGMACGCFPVAVDVGIVRELVRHSDNGMIVERSADAFRTAFEWCRENLEVVRSAGAGNAAQMRNTRTWKAVDWHWRVVFREALHRLKAVRPNAVPGAGGGRKEPNTWETNLGDNAQLGEWTERAEAAGRLVWALPLQPGDQLVDVGSGHSTIRRQLPSWLGYQPVDRLQRGADTLVMDLNHEFPAGQYRIATMLGILEYLADPLAALRWAAKHVQFCVFSYNDDPDPARRERQHWQAALSGEAIQQQLDSLSAKVRTRLDLGRSLKLYSVEFPTMGAGGQDRLAIAAATPPTSLSGPKHIGLLSAAGASTNAGDALITAAVQRLLNGHRFSVFPLLERLTEEQIEAINACDIAVVCGTNLYQHIFACALTREILLRIRVPILPLGIGTSAAIGQMPAMDVAGMEAVRLLHERCAVGSVRDPLSLSFVRSLGIRNVELTGCPVLFYGLREPQFTANCNGPLMVSIRARLLHVEERWLERERACLDTLSRALHPTLVVQSPFDVPIARELARKYQLDVLWNDELSSQPLVSGAQMASRSANFRLHFAMLCLSYGKLATLIGSDTRTADFCRMLGLPFHDIRSFQDSEVLAELEAPPAMDEFLRNWRSLRTAMVSLLKANGLESVAQVSADATWLTPQQAMESPHLRSSVGGECGTGKPRVLLIADVPDWIFARHCKMLERFLGDEFAFTVQYMGRPIQESEYDLIYPLEFNLMPPEQITRPSKWVTGIRSHTSWQDQGFLKLTELLAAKFQRVHAVSRRLQHIFQPFLPGVEYLAHGVDTGFFTARTRADQSGRRLRLGWAGSRMNPTKGFNEYIAPLGRLPGVELVFCGHLDVNLDLEGMRGFYDSLDAYICASLYEGSNNSLLEAAAMQRAIITTDNGTVPEYLRHGESALIVERTLADFTSAVLELRDNPAKRAAMGESARTAVAAKFEWKAMAEQYRALFRAALANREAWPPSDLPLSRKIEVP